MTMVDKPPITASFGPMVLTGIGSSSLGDQVGDAMADIVVWIIQLSCNCSPPPVVTHAFHTIFVAATVASAFAIHYHIVKLKQGE